MSKKKKFDSDQINLNKTLQSKPHRCDQINYDINVKRQNEKKEKKMVTTTRGESKTKKRYAKRK